MNFSEWLAKALGVSLSSIILLSFSRIFIPFRESAMPGIMLAFLGFGIGLLLLLKAELPRPSRNDLIQLLSCLILGAIILVHKQKFPIFPQNQSEDFTQHIRIATDYSNGAIPVLSAQILYYGIEYILALGMLSGIQPLLSAQYTMVILTSLSPMLFYLASLKLFGSRRFASMVSIIYALTGFLWYTMTLNAGLYSNFYGVLASLFLVAMTADFVGKRVGFSGSLSFGEGYQSAFKVQTSGLAALLLFILALLNAFLSHYTTLLLLIPLCFFVLLKTKWAKKGVAISGIILAPIALGSIAFSNLIETLGGFLAGSSGITYSTVISSLIPIPSLSYFVAEINNDWFFLLVVVPSLAVFVWQTWTRKSPELVFLLAWLLFILIAAPQAGASWRFSLVALVPLTLICGYVLALPIDKMKFGYHVRVTRKQFWSVIGIGFLMLFPVFYPSWGANQIGVALTDTAQFAEQQHEDYQAMLWMKDHSPPGATFISITDQQFSYSELVGGHHTFIAYQDSAGPNFAGFDAYSKGATYLIITNLVTANLPPNNFTTLKDANATRLEAKITKMILNMTSQPHAANIYSSIMTYNPDAKLYSQSILIDLQPWFTFTTNTLGLNPRSLVYNSTNVRIFCLLVNCWNYGK